MPPRFPSPFRGRPRLRLAIAALVGAAVVAFGAAVLVAQGPRATIVLPEVPRPIVFAHRGGSAEGPEATIPTMLAVIARNPGVAIELDVRASADQHVVVIHDATVDRTTNGTGRVNQLTLAALQALDAGHCATPGEGTGTARRSVCRDPERAAAFPLRGKGYRIPTLDEVLRALPRETILAIEVKDTGFEDRFAELLRASGRQGRLLIGSGKDGVAARLRELLPEVPHFFPVWAATRFALSAKLTAGHVSRPDYQVLAVPRAGGGLRLDNRRFVETAHRLGLFVGYFIINDEPEMERLVRLGADGLITDYPSRARAVAARVGGPPR